MELLRRRRDRRERLRRERGALCITIADEDTARVDYLPVRADGGSPYDTPDTSNLDDIEHELKSITATCAAWRKLEYQKKTDARVEELHEAWERRDLAR
eukprot:876965-Pyramimonas_sp.AAC.1